MTTKQTIVDIADNLVRDKGYNAFSFKDIANEMGIKTASIHYHFPTKSDLGLAVIEVHFQRFEAMKSALENQPPLLKLEGFLSLYSDIRAANKVCLVGSLATDLNTVDGNIKQELKLFSQMVLEWVTKILEEGKQQNEFQYTISSRAKALMIITNILAIVQLARLTEENDFELIRSAIIQDLYPNK